MPTTLTTTVATRRRKELELRAAGYVPITQAEAPFPAYADLLPACSVDQVHDGVRHGRLLWAHPGPSGLDPRAAVPLAVVRVADSRATQDLATATRWVLASDRDTVLTWLVQPSHRVLAGRRPHVCVHDSTRGCLVHGRQDRQADRVAAALGGSVWPCVTRRWRAGEESRWTGVVPEDDREALVDLPRRCLSVTLQLGGLARQGVYGAEAWLRVHGEDTAQKVALPPRRTRREHRRVNTNWNNYQLGRRGRPRQACTSCTPACAPPCPSRPVVSWSDYDCLAVLDDAYLPPHRPQLPVPCGLGCRTPLALSAVGGRGLR